MLQQDANQALVVLGSRSFFYSSVSVHSRRISAFDPSSFDPETFAQCENTLTSGGVSLALATAKKVLTVGNRVLTVVNT